ncbi:MAG TPA: ABC transporter substrate-binding protein [Stellaceae bacterium]|nr:ABC transporter substrate-binding protein [Stellaceae bacterium]
MPHRATFLGILTLAALAAVSARADDKLRVGTPEPTAFVFSPVDVGIETGIFKKHGLDAERVDFAGGAKLAQAMSAGAIDVAIATGTDILFVSRGAPERAVAAFGNDLNSLSLIARADDTVKTIDDVKGKTVGVTTSGSFTGWIARQIAIDHGWGPDGIKFAYLGSMNGIIAGLLAKDVDAVVGTTGQALVMQKEGRARIIVKAGDEIHNFIANMIYASDGMMNQHPEELRRFLAAWFDTMRFIKANKAETIRITQKDTKVPDDIASAIYDAEAPTFFSDGHFDRAKFAVVKQALIDSGQTDKMPPDDQLISEKFLP